MIRKYMILLAATTAVVAGTSLLTKRKTDKKEDLNIKIEHLVRNVEVYQPLFGINKYNNGKRDSKDRAEAIYNDILKFTHQNPNKKSSLNLIDIGSSLGYFTMFFADKGYKSLGIESNYSNYLLSQAVAEKNNLVNAKFKWKGFDDKYLKNMQDRYDIGLVLSVLHHINHKYGLSYTQKLINDLADKVSVLYLELATKDEPVKFPWRESLPNDIQDFFAKCKDCDVTLIGKFDNHLSKTKRPIYRLVKKKLTHTTTSLN